MKIKHFLSQLIPFLFAGIAIVAFVLGIMVLAYLFLFGAAIGFILFIIHLIKVKFFHKKTITRRNDKKGRVIDTDDWKEL